ncbi:MAG TPA: PorP/SprF family type IX secretion system membrane protein [Chitinophagaceae bacterium]|nr:PorP/SprF family type IX secretion system membrane protein [Chitinophagaceae bacterium]
MQKANKYKILLLTFSLQLVAFVQAQDLHFSQFFESPLLRNPALAGLFEGDIRIQSVYRDQWNSVTTGYRTGSINGEFKRPIGDGDDFVTMGMQLFYDKAGTVSYTNTQILPALNYHKSLSNEKNAYLSLGFMGGWVQHSIDLSKVTTNSQYDGMGLGENISDPTFSYLDGSVGMSFNSTLKNNEANNFYIGAAYHHFNRPKSSFYKNKEVELNPKFVFSGGLKLGVNEYSYITLQGDHSRQGSFKETVFGAMYGFRFGDFPDQPDYAIHFGTFFRWNDALIPAVKLDYHPFSVGISYDANISKLKPSSHGRGGFEISISWITSLKDRSNPYFNPRF